MINQAEIPANKKFFDQYITTNEEEETFTLKQIEKRILSKLQKGRVNLEALQNPYLHQIFFIGEYYEAFQNIVKFIQGSYTKEMITTAEDLRHDLN